MKAAIYKQSYDGIIGEMYVDVETMSDYATMTCRDCKGSGIYYLPDDKPIPCVVCKTSGKEYVNLM